MKSLETHDDLHQLFTRANHDHVKHGSFRFMQQWWRSPHINSMPMEEPSDEREDDSDEKVQRCERFLVESLIIEHEECEATKPTADERFCDLQDELGSRGRALPGVTAMTYEEFRKMDRSLLQATFREYNLLLTGGPTDRKDSEFGLEALELIGDPSMLRETHGMYYL